MSENNKPTVMAEVQLLKDRLDCMEEILQRFPSGLCLTESESSAVLAMLRGQADPVADELVPCEPPERLRPAVLSEIDLRRELRDVDEALNRVTKCQAPTRAQRIIDSFDHNKLVTDAAIFDHDKAEQSSRAQVVLWMGTAKMEAEQRIGERADAELRGACRLAMAIGYATGHADTYEQLVEHVREQKSESANKPEKHQ